MHAARLESSPRLQRLLAVLRGGNWYSTRELAAMKWLRNLPRSNE